MFVLIVNAAWYAYTGYREFCIPLPLFIVYFISKIYMKNVSLGIWEKF